MQYATTKVSKQEVSAAETLERRSYTAATIIFHTEKVLVLERYRARQYNTVLLTDTSAKESPHLAVYKAM